MFILCDTSSILMLLEIAPDMFIDPRYECAIIREVHDEIKRTSKFKDKYPWVASLYPKIRPTILSDIQKQKETLYFESISVINNQGTINEKTDKYFDLSEVDRKIISSALALEYLITSGDKALIQFAKQEFRHKFLGAVSPLELLNIWIEKGILLWSAELNNKLANWNELREHSQPSSAKHMFKKLTGNNYPGP